ncbi:hypothetical protein SETIT_2G096600v2 [Setaria italica]|uniref:AB hydrolase-1 domain-containing protein n=1 Tax=Setaria italica TaxID=4555 RepID=A0A368PX67_SETIT|nr:hypothetical protein SETIT_2G096600v2 [Setaria italica]
MPLKRPLVPARSGVRSWRVTSPRSAPTGCALVDMTSPSCRATDRGVPPPLRRREPGAMEAELARMDTRFIFRRILTTRDTGAISLSPEWWGPPDRDIPLPPWLPKEYVDRLAAKFDETGFAGAINFYRCLNLNWELTAPWTGAKVAVPTKYMAGEEAMSCSYTGVQEYIHKGGLKGDVPGLEEVAVVAGAAHCIHLEKPEEVTEHIYDFIKRF